jgi:hypothetical protein
MAIIIKIYQSKLISEVLAAPGFPEVKDGINNTFSSLKKHNVGDDQILKLVEHTLKELKILNQSKLSYDQHANIITAKVHLQQLQLQMMNVIN